jgi:hypothetical protein
MLSNAKNIYKSIYDIYNKWCSSIYKWYDVAVHNKWYDVAVHNKWYDVAVYTSDMM